MRTWLFTAIAGGAFGITAAACVVSKPSPPDENEGEFCADWAKALCQIGSGNCEFDVSACQTYQLAQCTNRIGTAQTGTREYNQPNGKACIDMLNGAYGGNPSSIPASTLLAIDATCNKVVVGTQTSGGPCTADSDCSGTLICAPEVGQNQSMCVSGVTPKNLGDVCADPGDQCEGDSYCALPPSGLPKCVATAATGGLCSTSIPCGSSDQCVSGVCTARGGTGDPCQSNDDCSASLYCDTYTPAECTTGLTFARLSADCKGIEGVDQTDATGPTVTVTDSGLGAD
jgi:hypothetical protein